MQSVRMFTLAMLVVLVLSMSAAAQVTIEVGIAETWQPAGVEYIENVLVPAFEAANPGIKVNVTVIGWSMDNYVTRYVANAAPDVLQIGGDRVGTYVNMIEPLDSYAQGWDDLADFPPALLEGSRVNGKLYGIPWSMPIRSLKYRVDHFLEAGLDANQPPATWADLVDYGSRLTRLDGQGNMIRQGYKADNHWLEWAGFLYQAGGDFMNADRTRFTFGSEAGQEAVAFTTSLVQEHRISHPSKGLGGIETGESSMEVMQGSVLHFPEFRDIIAVAPPLTHAVQTQVAYANQWAITNTSPNKDAAWKWIQFATHIDNMVGYTHAALIVPPRMSIINYEPWSSDPRFLQMFQNTTMSKPMPFDSPHIDQARRSYIQPALQRIMYEGAPVTELVEQERLANAWLQDQL